MNAGRQTTIAGLVLLAMAAAAGAVTTNSVTWSGGGGMGNPYWTNDANWAGGQAPSNPLPATVFYDAGGQAVTGLLDAARTIGRISASEVAANHTLDLGGHTLTVTGNLESAILGTLSLRQGTLRIGTDASEGNILPSNQWNPGTPTVLRLEPGMTLDPYRINTIRVGRLPVDHINNGNARLDLRGVTIAGGNLRARNIRIQTTYRSTYSYLALDGATAISALTASNELTVGEGAYGGTSYIGDPADSGFRLPAGMDIRVGVSPSMRGSLQVGKNAEPGNALSATLAAATGGTFVAYLSALKVVPYEAAYSGNAQQNGLLDLAAMTNCSIDAQSILVAPNYSLNTLAQPRGTLRLCPGTVTAGTVEIGAGLGAGYGLLQLSNTVFTVTNSFTIAATGVITNYLGAQPSGIDADGAFTDGGGRIRAVFTDAPAAATNWAIRVKGDAQSTLHGMVGAGRLSSTGTYAGKKTGVLYDAAAGYTYYAMADTNAFSTLPVAIAHDERTFEIAPAGTARVDVSEINRGSYDPDGRTPVALTVSTDGLVFASNVQFAAAGDYPVTLKIEIGSPVTASATDTCLVHVAALHAGVTSNLTWLGAASTVLMDRREWWWKGSWVGGLPPANPTPGTITFGQFGTSVTSLLEQARQIGGLTVPSYYTHTLNLGGCTLTVTGTFANAGSVSFTNGTLRIGTGGAEGNLSLGRAQNAGTPTVAILRPGTVLDTYRVNTIHLGNIPPEHVNDSTSGFDLRGAVVAGGWLTARNVKLNCSYRHGAGTYIAIDGRTAISGIAVSNELTIGSGFQGGLSYIGNPAAAGYALPTNVSLRVGISPAERGFIRIGQNSGLNDPNQSQTAVLAASTGGVFEAYLTSLKVVPYEATYSATMSAAQNGTLDLGGMSSCTVDVGSLVVAANYSTSANANPRGTVRLPPGNVLAGTAEVGATNGLGFGALHLSNTVFMVTNSLTLRRTAQVTVNVGATSSGFVISNALDTAFDMTGATNNALRIRFLVPPASVGLHTGFRWLGDHVAAVQGLVSAGTIVMDDAGLGSKRAGVFKYAGSTYIGINTAGTVFIAH